jgi:predicted component of type VI protein secretion system
MPQLIVTMPDGNEVTHDLTDEVITIGRIEDNMIQIEDGSVSSHHAQLTLSGGDYHLKDLGSTNGTRLNGEAFEEGMLQDGDHVRFGHVESRYASEIAAQPRASQELPQQMEAAVLPAAESHRPASFANASPFQTKKKKKDPLALGVMIFAIVALLVFCAAVAMIMSLQPPAGV